MIWFAKTRMIPEPPRPTIEGLNASAIGMRNRGQNAVATLGQGYIGLDDWLRREFDRLGYDQSQRAVL